MVADELRALPKRMKIMLKRDINESILKYQMQLEEHESKTSKFSAQPSESTGFRSFTESFTVLSNGKVNKTPCYHTFAMTGTHSQAFAGDVDGTPSDPKYVIQTNDRGMKL